MDRKLEERLNRLEAAVGSPEIVRHMNFKVTADASDSNHTLKTTPIDGVIKSALIQFDSGTDNNVQAFIYHAKTKVLPETRQGITLNNTTENFGINEPVENGDAIELRVINDDTSSHTVVAVVKITGGR